MLRSQADVTSVPVARAPRWLAAAAGAPTPPGHARALSDRHSAAVRAPPPAAGSQWPAGTPAPAQSAPRPPPPSPGSAPHRPAQSAPPAADASAPAAPTPARDTVHADIRHGGSDSAP